MGEFKCGALLLLVLPPGGCTIKSGGDGGWVNEVKSAVGEEGRGGEPLEMGEVMRDSRSVSSAFLL